MNLRGWTKSMVGPIVPSVEKRVAALALTAAFVFRIAVAWAPLEWLLRRVLGDDPFYYFTIARHLGAGLGFSFDAVEPTNGFHPLWLLVITPIFGLVRDPARAVHLALTVAACIDVVALFLFHRLLRAAGVRASVAAAAALLYALSPIVLSGAGPLNGLETALNLALTFAFLGEYRKAFVGDAAGTAAALRLGVCSGLLLLTRTDNAFLIVFCHGALLWRARLRTGFRAAVAPVIVAVAVAAPWLAWSALRFGSVIQVSGLSVAHVTRELVNPEGWTVASLATKLVHNLGTLATYIPIYHLNRNSFVAAAAGNAVVILALALGTALCFRNDVQEGRRRLLAEMGPWAAPLGACVALIVIHTLRAVELRAWYYTSVVPLADVVLAISAGYIADWVTSLPRAARRILSVGVPAALALILASALRVGAAPRCGEIDAYATIGSVNRTLPDGARLGSWNAGLFGYFYARGHVVNLDGLVNNAAYDHILTRSIGAYAAGREIDYLLDAAGAIELAARYWDGGRSVVFPRPVLDNGATMECRRMVLLPLR